MPILKKQRHELFAQQIVAGTSPAQAYVNAGYNITTDAAAASAGNRLLQNVDIQARIVELQTKVAQTVVLDRAWVLERLMKNARIAMGEETIRTKVMGEDGVVVEVDVSARNGNVANKALELLGKTKELRMWVDQVESGLPGEFDRMSKEEIEDFIRKERVALGEVDPPKPRLNGGGSHKPNGSVH